MSDLQRRTAALLAQAQSTLPDPGLGRYLEHLRARLNGPVRVAVLGRVKAGKSTLVNALLGERLAPTDAGECTRIPLWFHHCASPTVRLVHEGGSTPLPFTRDGELRLTLPPGLDPERIDVGWPTSQLRAITLIDSPGLGSATTRLTGPDLIGRGSPITGAPPPLPVDAVVYVMRHLHASDVHFLEAFRTGAGGTPVNAIAALGRADEAGGGRLDALDVSQRIAQRIAGDQRIRRLCSGVVPVAGLLAQESALADESLLHGLRQVAALPDPDHDEILGSARRFADDAVGLGLAREERVALLARLGIFGVRWGARQVCLRPSLTVADLSESFAEVSGLSTLRAAIRDQFATRGATLVASSVLTDLTRVLAAGPNPSQPARDFLAAAERIRADSLELTAWEIVTALARQVIDLGTARDEVIRTLSFAPGDRGLVHWQQGLELAAGEPAAMREELSRRVDRWRAAAEHPLADSDRVFVARTMVRALERASLQVAALAGRPG